MLTFKSAKYFKNEYVKKIARREKIAIKQKQTFVKNVLNQIKHHQIHKTKIFQKFIQSTNFY